MSRSSSFFATTHFSAVPSRLLSIAVQACLSSLKLSCSRCSLITSTQVSMQPSESSLNSLGFLKVFRDLPLPLSLDSVFLCSFLRMLHRFPGTGPRHGILLYTRMWNGASDLVVEFEAPTFIAVLVPPDAMVQSIRVNGVDSRFFCCGSTMLTLVPDGFSITILSCAIEFLKSTSNLDLVPCSLCPFWSLDSTTFHSRCRISSSIPQYLS